MDAIDIWVALGWTGQVCFFTRFLVQWLASERAKRSMVPRVFWRLSLAGAICVLAYALHLKNPVFVLSTLPAMIIYGRNLFVSQSAPRARLLPVAAALALFVVWAALIQPYVDNLLWGAIGFCGSIIWSSRFIVQWWASERIGTPTMPTAFWVMSLVGNVLLLSYAIYKRDPVFIPGQSIGFLVYARNLYLIHRAPAGQRA